MLDVKSLTTGEKEGYGLFEELMRAANSHIQAEHEAGRISGTNYATVYLGMMQTAMQTAMQYALQYPTVNKQIELMNWQISQAEKQDKLLEYDRMAKHIANETAKYNLCKILPEQLTKAITENLVLRYRADQEYAQTHDRLPDGSEVGGAVGKDIYLKDTQAQSFVKNTEIQVGKLYSDVLNVIYAASPENAQARFWGLGEDPALAVMTKILNSIGVQEESGRFDDFKYEHDLVEKTPTAEPTGEFNGD